jgi:uncharacterized membrane protein YccC
MNTGAASTLWRALIRIEPQKIVPQIAVRNTIGFIFALILGTVFSSPATGAVAGLGALNVCYSDSLGPYRIRAGRMLLATLLVGAAVIIGAISGENNISAAIVAAAWAFAAGMLVALGPVAGDLGVMTLVTLVVFAAKPLAPLAALETGAVAIAGGLLQTLCSTFLWPLRRYAPERRIIGGLYAGLAEIARSPAPPVDAPPISTQISEAHHAFAPLSRDHSIEAERNVFLLVQAERIRLSILNAVRLRRRLARDQAGIAAANILDRILNHAADVMQSLSDSVPAGGSAELLNNDLIEFHKLQPNSNAFLNALLRDAKQQAATLRSQIRSAAWAESGAAPQGYSAERALPWRLRFQGNRARLLANLSLNSTAFRHAVRMAGCLAIGDIIGRSLTLQRTYWIPMTIAIVLKPDFTGTFARGVLRVGGTLAGLVLTTLLFRALHPGIVLEVILLAVFTFSLRWAGPANYGLFVIAISGLVVMLVAVTGIEPGAVIAARAQNTSIGGILALAAYALWPSWEKRETPSALAHMIDTYRIYTHAVFEAWQNESRARIDDVRVEARIARTNAQGSVDRMRGEPNVTERQGAALNSILVHSHSFIHAVMAMESRLYRNPRDPAPLWLPKFASSVDSALTTFSSILLNSSAISRKSKVDVEVPPPGTSGNELAEIEADRIRTSLRSLGEELAKRDWL